MKITVITVCYNSALTIEQTFLSVASQTYRDLEYIVVDGNSVDNTLGLIEKYDSVITKWISEPDLGIYDAINKGISMATGDLIGILNSDDTFYSNKVLENIVKFHNSIDIDASVGNIIQHRINGKVVRLFSSINWHPWKLKIGLMPPHPSIFIKRELFDKYGNYNLGFKIGADYELVTRFFLKNNIKWAYNGITTTSMLVGGVSSSGVSSYSVITTEISKALEMNQITFSSLLINIRFFWKFIEYIKLK